MNKQFARFRYLQQQNVSDSMVHTLSHKNLTLICTPLIQHAQNPEIVLYEKIALLSFDFI